MNYYVSAWKKYFDFSGRASRSEFWYFSLFNLIIQIGVSVLFGLLGESMATIGLVITGLYGLAAFIPGLAVSVRRLHDTNKSGWWLLLGFIPIIGIIVLIVFWATDSFPGKNQYGENPKVIKTIQA